MLTEKELKYWTDLTDPKHGYGEIVVEDAKRVLKLNEELMIQAERTNLLIRRANAAVGILCRATPVSTTFYPGSEAEKLLQGVNETHALLGSLLREAYTPAEERVTKLEAVAAAALVYRKEKNPVNFGMLAFHLKRLLEQPNAARN